MAGVFLSFLVEYVGSRFVARRRNNHTTIDSEQQSNLDKTVPIPTQHATVADLGHSHAGLMHPDNRLSVAVMESGIVFHSICKSITLSTNTY
jgi:zinc transporter 1/2/3